MFRTRSRSCRISNTDASAPQCSLTEKPAIVDTSIAPRNLDSHRTCSCRDRSIFFVFSFASSRDTTEHARAVETELLLRFDAKADANGKDYLRTIRIFSRDSTECLCFAFVLFPFLPSHAKAKSEFNNVLRFCRHESSSSFSGAGSTTAVSFPPLHVVPNNTIDFVGLPDQADITSPSYSTSIFLSIFNHFMCIHVIFHSFHTAIHQLTAKYARDGDSSGHNNFRCRRHGPNHNHNLSSIIPAAAPLRQPSR